MMIAKYFLLLLVAVGVMSTATAGATYYRSHHVVEEKKSQEPTVMFVMEGYDVIMNRLWQKVSDQDLAKLVEASVQKASGTAKLASTDRAGAQMLLGEFLDAAPAADRVKNAETLLQIMLYNLPPIGRNQLLTSTARQDLSNEVNNVHPGNDLYQSLGLTQGASAASVQSAYESKRDELSASTSPQAQKELEKVAYAKEVLTATTSKANYDAERKEPTVFARLVNPKTLYVYIASMSPQTESEFENMLRDKVKDGVSSMILDLRGNIGGDLTTAQTFLGLFSGPNQYAFDFYNRGEYKAQRTLGLGAMKEAKQLREVAVLTDGLTQSTAEVVTAAMKRLRLAKSVGERTRGWGSVEQIVPMQTSIDPGGQHSLLLVVELTVRDDAEPIETNGVIPDVDTSKPGWQDLLSEQFFSKDLIAAIKKQASIPPQKF